MGPAKRKSGKGKQRSQQQPKQMQREPGASTPEQKPAEADAEEQSPKAASTNSKAPAKERPFPIVGIGASAGGLEAFIELLKHLPEKTGMAYVLVQHLDPKHSSALQEILSRATKIPVTEVTEGVTVDPDHIYVIPANTNMSLSDGVLRLAARILVQGQHMPINYFLNSLAVQRGEQAIAVILSGTASDGTEGCAAVKTAGGITFAQEERSAKYASMPRNAINSGCVDFVMPPAEIARELVRIGRHPYLRHPSAPKEEEESSTAEGKELDAVLALLQKATGVDFAHYKQSTMQRRITRRMVLHQVESLKEYLRFIKRNPQEIDQLYRDILIHVTGFFRDPESFVALGRVAFPNIFKDRSAHDWPVRVWVPGCSTGEEVYSIVICLLEYVWEQDRTLPLAQAGNKMLQVFATDLSDPALERARMGLYSESAVAGVSRERLKRFFSRTEGGYQINKSVREMCIFARQNVTKDPPFSNLDLVSCRNLLIYLAPVLQKRVIPMLHYALKPGGYLLLGGSENLTGFEDYFTLVDKKNKLYQKKKSGARLITYFSPSTYTAGRSESEPPGQPEPGIVSVESEVQRLLLNRYVPAGIVVNSDMEIVQFRGKTGAYLEPPHGQPSFNLTKMAREGLLVDLCAALNQAKRENLPARREGVHVQSNGGTREVDIEVIPVRGGTAQDRFYAIVFQEAPNRESTPPKAKEQPGKKTGATALERERDRAVQEGKQLREELQALIEDHETTLEEFKSANEEVLSANEELQSTNEELETAKEELQSTNEELTTLNEELQNRNAELTLANNDLLNLFANANVPVVILGNDLHIRRFTPPAQKLLNLLPGDVGRRIREIRPNVDIDSVEQLAREAIENATAQEREVRDVQDGGWHMLRVRPYKTFENRIDGAVISFQDITAFKRELELARKYADAVIENAREPTLVLDGDLRVTVANQAFYRDFNVSPAETEGRLLYELGSGEWNVARLRQLLDHIAKDNSRVDDFEVQHDFPGLGLRTMLLNARRIEPEQGKPMILLAIEGVSEKSQYLEALKRQAALLDLAHDAVIVSNFDCRVQYWNRGAEELYGWKSEEARGKTTTELLKSECPQPLAEIQEQLLRTGHWEGEIVHTRRDGSKRVVSSRWALQQQNGDRRVVLQINSDVTERKRSEEAMRRLSGRLMRIQDEERRRLARELHDSTGQRLTAIKINLGLVQSQFASNSHESSTLTEAMGWVDDTLQEIRTVAQLLHPPTLDEAGLASAIRWLADGFSNRCGIQVDLSLPDSLNRMPEEIELALFRVVQEALNNIHRHSEAKRTRIELLQRPGMATLTVSDDGKGVPAAMLLSEGETKPLGVGILGMRERLAQFGGTLEIRNGHKGATVVARVPIPAEQAATAQQDSRLETSTSSGKFLVERSGLATADS
jgi:two-component system CheB/CheR fusion protein